MKKLFGRIWCITLMAALFTGICFAAGHVTAEAASVPYQNVEIVNGEKPVKVGKYYFKSVYSDGGYSSSLKVSKKKSSGYRTICKADWIGDIVTNGKTVYYVKNGNALYSYNISKKKNKQLKKLSVNDDVSYEIGAVYGKNVYLTKSSFYKWRLDTYMYNTASKKYKKVKSHYGIKDQYGRYVVGQEEFRTDVSAYPIRVCKLTSSGMTKGKRLAKNGFSETYIGNKLYYTKSSDRSMDNTVLYRAKVNGTKPTVLGKFRSGEEYGQAVVSEITSKYCIVYKDGKTYKYTYKTKKMKEIK